jgi:prepilin-type N-terminal cleavage/methylation domain-containing protein
MKNSRLASRSGFSFVEVMAAMAAGLVVVAAALQSVVYFQRQFARQHEEVIRQQDVRLGLELFAQELRLAGPGSLSVARTDVVEFMANVSGLMTNASAPVVPGQTTVAVEDGRGWPDGKLVSMCWNDQCELSTLARAGQRNVLTFVEPARRSIPSGASAAVMNRVRYYSRPDERGILRWLRQIDGGASVIAGNLESFTLRYWDAEGRSVVRPELVRRIQIEITLPARATKVTREITLRT